MTITTETKYKSIEDAYDEADICSGDFPCCVEIGYEQDETGTFAAYNENELFKRWEEFCKETNTNPEHIQYVYRLD